MILGVQNPFHLWTEISGLSLLLSLLSLSLFIKILNYKFGIGFPSTAVLLAHVSSCFLNFCLSLPTEFMAVSFKCLVPSFWSIFQGSFQIFSEKNPKNMLVKSFCSVLWCFFLVVYSSWTNIQDHSRFRAVVLEHQIRNVCSKPKTCTWMWVGKAPVVSSYDPR